MKPYHLCHGRLGCAAPLIAHQQNYDHTGERRRAEDPISKGIFCDIAHPPVDHQLTNENSNIRFNMDASQECGITGNFPLLRFFGHRSRETGLAKLLMMIVRSPRCCPSAPTAGARWPRSG